jgi:hypothetical protein
MVEEICPNLRAVDRMRRRTIAPGGDREDRKMGSISRKLTGEFSIPEGKGVIEDNELTSIFKGRE